MVFVKEVCVLVVLVIMAVAVVMVIVVVVVVVLVVVVFIVVVVVYNCVVLSMVDGERSPVFGTNKMEKARLMKVKINRTGP